VPACGVVAEAMLALVLADAMLEKFGADSLPAMRAAYDHYVAEVARWSGSS
jgi:chorismate synthase